jgi:hypothetical protein
VNKGKKGAEADLRPGLLSKDTHVIIEAWGAREEALEMDTFPTKILLAALTFWEAV